MNEKRWVIGRSYTICPVCKNNFTFIAYRSVDDPERGPGNDSIAFCRQCVDEPSKLISEIKKVLMKPTDTGDE